MSKALSVDLRRRVVEAVAAGASCRAAAARFEVGVSSAIRWLARARTRGDLSPDKRGGNVRSHRFDEHRNLILGSIGEKPDLTLAEVAERLDETVGYRPLPSIVCRFFQRHGVTRKKDSARCRTRSSGCAHRREARRRPAGGPAAPPAVGPLPPQGRSCSYWRRVQRRRDGDGADHDRPRRPDALPRRRGVGCRPARRAGRRAGGLRGRRPDGQDPNAQTPRLFRSGAFSDFGCGGRI